MSHRHRQYHRLCGGDGDTAALRVPPAAIAAGGGGAVLLLLDRLWSLAPWAAAGDGDTAGAGGAGSALEP